MIDMTTFGLASATLTPFRADGSIDTELLKAHSDSLLDSGCDWISLFGTTGEGPSVHRSERQRAITYLNDHGFDFSKCVMGVSGSAAGDVVSQVEAAQAVGCTTFLIPPPFYFKGIAQDGLAAWYRPMLRRMSELDCQAILYHIPQVTLVSLSADLLRALHTEFPKVVSGVKDSAGDMRTTEAFLAIDGLSVLVGDERLLGSACARGAVGAISGLANIIPGLLRDMISAGRQNDAISTLVDAIVRHPVTPAIKAVMAHISGVRSWLNTLPPFTSLSPEDAKSVIQCHQSLMVKTSQTRGAARSGLA